MASVGTKTEFMARVMRRVGTIDSVKLTPTAEVKPDLADEALAVYEGFRPRERMWEQPGSETERRFVLSETIGGWQDGTNRIAAVYRVADANQHNEMVEEIDLENWSIEPNTGGKEVLILAGPIGAFYTLRIRYCEPHLVHETDGTFTTVPDRDTEALTLLGVAAACAWIARTAADMADQNLGSDQVDYGEIGRRWAKRGEEAATKASDLLAPDKTQARAGGGSVSWTSRSPLTGRSRVSH